MESTNLIHNSVSWIAQHVRSTQYMTQIIKCLDKNCCGTIRSKFHKINKSRFFPAPILLHYAPMIEMESMDINKLKYTSLFQSLHLASPESPYDQYCPSVNDKVQSRTCKKCKIYFASLTLLSNHKKIHSREVISPAAKTRTKRVLRQREREFMVITEESPGFETCEWVDMDSRFNNKFR